MKSKAERLFLVLVLVLGLVPAVVSADFTPPAEGPVAFRRDKLTLDEESISALSRQLEILARGLPMDSATQRRAAAQMLALALALDPGNGRARQLVNQYKKDVHQPETARDQLEKNRARIWQSIAWLDSADAGSHGNALAACLKDVIVISDSNHPKAQAIIADGEKGAWTGWVSPLAAFEHGKTAGNSEERVETPKDPLEEKPARILLESARVWTLLWNNTGSEEIPKWLLAQGPLGMTAKTANLEQIPFTLQIGANEESKMFDHTKATLIRLLTQEHGELPKNLRVTITSKEFETSISSKKLQSISAAAAVLASAAVTGVEPDAIILGQIDGTGAYKLSSRFWKQIRSLGKGSGRKLVLPAEAESHIPAQLAMEHPEFFIEYEVLLAKDFKHLLALSAKQAESPLAPTFSKFKEIRDKSAGQDLRQYIANRFVRQRLAEVSEEMPDHVSSKMLLLQAEGKRPTLISRKVLAAELLAAMEPLASLAANPDEELSTGQIRMLGDASETSRAAVDALERYATKKDRPLVEQTRDTIVAVRAIERASRIRGEDYKVKQAIQSARSAWTTRVKKLMHLLITESGDTPSP